MRLRFLISTTVFLLLILSSCELIVIGEKYSKPIPAPSRSDSYGVIALWKLELDSGNTLAACDMLSGINGEKLLAIDQYELEFELARINNILSQRQVTSVQSDSLSETKWKYIVEYGYTKKFSFITSLQDSVWSLSSWEQLY